MRLEGEGVDGRKGSSAQAAGEVTVDPIVMYLYLDTLLEHGP